MSKKISTLFICLFLVLSNLNVYAQTASQINICNTNEVVIVFLNGIKNIYKDALNSRNALEEFYDKTTL